MFIKMNVVNEAGKVSLFIVSSQKEIDADGKFRQLHGNIFVAKKNIGAWYWGVDPKTGRLYKRNGKACAWASIRPVPDFSYILAATVQAAYQDGKNVVNPVAVSMPAPKTLLDRLNDGDPEAFVELGASKGHAVQWSDWIRENRPLLVNVDDLKKVKGIGKKTVEALKNAMEAKHDA